MIIICKTLSGKWDSVIYKKLKQKKEYLKAVF